MNTHAHRHACAHVYMHVHKCEWRHAHAHTRHTAAHPDTCDAYTHLHTCLHTCLYVCTQATNAAKPAAASAKQAVAPASKVCARLVPRHDTGIDLICRGLSHQPQPPARPPAAAARPPAPPRPGRPSACPPAARLPPHLLYAHAHTSKRSRPTENSRRQATSRNIWNVLLHHNASVALLHYHPHYHPNH